MKRFSLGLFSLIILVALCSSLNAEFNKTSTLIDIPTAYILPSNTWSFSTNGSVAITSTPDNIWEKNPRDMDVTVSYGIGGRAEAAITMYTVKDYVLDLAFLLTTETSRVPAIAIGVQNISYSKYICEVGRGDEITDEEGDHIEDQINGWGDDNQYETTYQRNSEQFSAFLVVSKSIGDFANFHLGVGRGKFVGYGPRSKYFNSDMFTDSVNVQDHAVGIIWGAAFDLYRGFGPMVDFDGRDLNAGLQYKSQYFRICMAAVKIEQSIPGTRELHSRVAFGTQLYFEPQPKQLGQLAGKVWDIETAEPLAAVISFPDKKLNDLMTTEGTGSYGKMTLPPGVYVVRASAPGYYWKQKKVSIEDGRTTICNFALQKKGGVIKGHVYDAKTKEPVQATISVVNTSTNQEVAEVLTVAKGAYKVTLPKGTYMLKLTPGIKGYIYQESRPIPLADGQTVIQDFPLLKKAMKFVFHNILFDFDKATLRPESYPVLDTIALIMIQNPTIYTELSGHTDSRGSNSYNQRLSQRRVEAARSYILQKWNIPSVRMSARGYGEEVHIIPNAKTEEEHQLNRRVEFKILRGE